MWDNYNCSFVNHSNYKCNSPNMILKHIQRVPIKQPTSTGLGGGATRKAYRATKIFKLKTPLIVRDYIFCEPDKGFIKKRERDFSLRFNHLS